MLLGGYPDEGELVGGVQVPHQALGPLRQLGHLRRVLRGDNTVLFCTVLYSTLLYCTVLHCTVTVLYCTEPQ